MSKSMFLSVLLLPALLFNQALANPPPAGPESATQKAVLVTGASSGLGREMAELLASEGFFVYAGARKDSDIAELNQVENMQAIRLDVTKQQDIDQAVAVITEAGRGLYGLINNAGVAVVAPLIEVDEEDFDFQMDVNVYGPYRVTKAFAPLIIASKGRISTTSSISGVLAGPLLGPYSMSKHAIEAFTDSLADEMAKFGVKVSAIEPGSYNSDIGKNMFRRMEARGQSIDDSMYKEEYENMMAWMKQFETSGNDPADVARAALDAMSSDTPKRRYMVVPDQGQAEITITQAISEVVQFNRDQKFSYDREQLIKILDQELAKNP
jgi:NAD(P)-dependent dehydrogenase (short-subunit alcohol dehydrogenase family)